MRLEDITEGSIVMGIVPHEPVTVVTTKWHGTACLDVFYKTNRGQTGERVVFREDEESLEVVQKSLPQRGQMLLQRTQHLFLPCP